MVISSEKYGSDKISSCNCDLELASIVRICRTAAGDSQPHEACLSHYHGDLSNRGGLYIFKSPSHLELGSSWDGSVEVTRVCHLLTSCPPGLECSNVNVTKLTIYGSCCTTFAASVWLYYYLYGSFNGSQYSCLKKFKLRNFS